MDQKYGFSGQLYHSGQNHKKADLSPVTRTQKKIGFLGWVWVFLSKTQTHTQKPKKTQNPTQHPTQITQKICVSKKILSVY
jgi:hypothetical protein